MPTLEWNLETLLNPLPVDHHALLIVAHGGISSDGERGSLLREGIRAPPCQVEKVALPDERHEAKRGVA